ncbi:MAG TPA: glycosyltransferase family 4 protein [Candidatus Binatia bacterium]
MGILVITWNYPPRRGGIEYLLRNLCAGLRQRHSVQVITAHARCEERFAEQIFRAPVPGLIPFSLYAFWVGVVLLLRSPVTQVIFGGSVMVAPLVVILARLSGRKAIVQAHGLDVIYASKLYQTLCVRWLRSCDRILANSGYTASLVAGKGVRTECISVIPPGVLTESFMKPTRMNAMQQTLGLRGKKNILFVGRLAKRKGVKEFIEKSFVRVVRELPDACFVIAGNNPSDALTHRADVASEIQAVVSNLGLQNHVRLAGSLSDDDVISLYHLSDVVVLPALACTDDVEGFGIVLLEAAAAGKPVVATRVGGIPDAVEDGKSGILVNAGDYEGFTQTLISLLLDAKKRALMGAYAKVRITEQFSWQRIVRQYEKTLEL